MVDETFEEASRAMELWPEMIVFAEDAAREGDYKRSAHYVRRLVEELKIYGGREPIRSVREQLVLVSHAAPGDGYTSEHEAVLGRVDTLHFMLVHEIGVSGCKYADKIMSDGIPAAFEDYLVDSGTMIFDMQEPLDRKRAKEAKVRLCWERSLILKSKNGQLPPRPPAAPVWLGDGRFLYDGVMRTMEGAELAVTNALIKHGPLTKPKLETHSQVPDAVGVFHKLAAKYPAAYHKPGKRNLGGYSHKFRQEAAEKAS